MAKSFAELRKERLSRFAPSADKEVKFGGFWYWRETMDKLNLWPGMSSSWRERDLEEKQ